MKINLYYPEIDFNYPVLIWKDEIIEYLWEKNFDKKFNSLTYLLEDKEGKVYNDLELKWLHNELDEDSIKNDPDFNKFLLDRFESTAYWRYEAIMEEKEKKEQELEKVFNYVNNFSSKKDYLELNEEELEEIFLENFGGEI